MDCSMPGFSDHHQHPQPAQTHGHRVTDAIQPSHPLSSPSPPLPNPFQYQGIFQWVNSSHEVAKVLDFQLQHQSFQWIFRVDFLKDWPVWSPCSPRDSQESPLAPQFESINSLAVSLLYGPTFTSVHDHWKNHSLDYMDLCWQSDTFAFNYTKFVIAFLPRSNHLLISRLRSAPTMILEPRNRSGLLPDA